jgi:hypothetical protein
MVLQVVALQLGAIAFSFLPFVVPELKFKKNLLELSNHLFLCSVLYLSWLYDCLFGSRLICPLLCFLESILNFVSS